MSFNIFVEIGYDADNLREQARNAVIDYVNNLPVGGTIIWNDVITIINNIPGITDFVTDYFKIGDYNPYQKLNKKQIVLRTINQRSHDNQKFYTDRGLIRICTRQ
jgi:hypothetical protein